MTPGMKTAIKSLLIAVMGFVVSYLTLHVSSLGIPEAYLPVVTASLVAITHWLPKPNDNPTSLNPLSTSAQK